MCEANAYLFQDGQEELLLERVDKLQNHDCEIYLENIFGIRKTISARIKELRLVDHCIILEKIEEE